MARDYRDALKMLGLLAQGKYSLGAIELATVVTTSNEVVISSPASVFGRDQLRSFH